MGCPFLFLKYFIKCLHIKIKLRTITVKLLMANKITLPIEAIELQILKGLCEGYTTKEIAQNLKINQRTFERAVAILKAKYNCKTLSQLVAFFFRNKLIKLN